MQAIPYAEAVARKFRLERAPTLLAQREAVAPIVFTRLRSEGPFRGRTMATLPEEAFSFLVALAPMQAGEVWIDGQYSKLPAASVGDTFVFNLAVNTIARLNPPYDFLRFYMSSATLDQLAYDGGVTKYLHNDPRARAAIANLREKHSELPPPSTAQVVPDAHQHFGKAGDQTGAVH